MINRRLTTGVLAFVVVAGLTAAATQARPTGKAAPASAAVTTTVTLSGWASSPAETAALRETIAAFERKYRNIKVNYAPISGDYPAAMLTKFAARQPPDLFYVDSNVLLDWSRQGVLEPLDGFLKRFPFNTKPFYPRLLNAFKGADGKLYGFPKDWSPLGMEVNNDFLRRAGVTVPKTWTQLKQAAQKIRSSGVLPSGARPICLHAEWQRALAFVYQNKGAWLNPQKTKSLVTSKFTKQGVEFYINLLHSGLAGIPAQIGAGWCGEAIGKERAAITFEGNWIVGYLKDEFPKVDWSVHPMIRNRQEGNLAFTVSYSIGRHSKNKSAAWTLLTFLTGKEGMGIWTRQGIALPSRSDVKTPPGRSAFIQAAPHARPWQFKAGFAKVVDIANNEFTATVEGKQSVDAMLQKIDEAIKDALD